MKKISEILYSPQLAPLIEEEFDVPLITGQIPLKACALGEILWQRSLSRNFTPQKRSELLYDIPPLIRKLIIWLNDIKKFTKLEIAAVFEAFNQ